MLDSTTIQEILNIGKKNLELDGKLYPILFFRLQTGEQLYTALKLPDGADMRRLYITGLGFSLLKDGKVLEEAVMLTEGWVVAVNKKADYLAVAPSQHPQRKEAIIMIGRDAAKSRQFLLIQPFTRGSKNEPLWEKVEGIMPDDDPKASELCYQGLLDFLFVRERVKQVA